ncbi:MAG: PAS domain-containing protein, partial [Pseudomonadota bacterium]|nr:PAS domain-containing protein [Pseudomonadota bacterium]
MDTNDLLSVLEMGTDSILVHDGSFPLFYNRSFLDLFGYKTGSDYERCVQKNGLFKKFHHEDLKRVINSHDDRMAGNSRYTKYYSARIVREPKDVRWIDLKISSIDWQGDHAVLVAIQDSTEAINRSKSNTHFQSLFTHVLSDTPAIITLTSIATGEYFHVSDMFQTVMGYDKNWIIGRSSYELNIWVFEEERQHIADELAAGRNVVNYECSVYKRDGSIIPTSVWARVIHSEPEDMLLIVGFDRSAEVDRLQKIESLNHQLQLMATTDAL